MQYFFGNFDEQKTVNIRSALKHDYSFLLSYVFSLPRMPRSLMMHEQFITMYKT